MRLFYQSLRPSQHGTSQDRDGGDSRSVHHLECFIPLGSNFRPNKRACEIPSKTLAKKIAGYVIQLKWIQRGPVGVIPIKLQEEESQEGQLGSFLAVFLPMILYSMCESPSELFTDYLQAQKWPVILGYLFISSGNISSNILGNFRSYLEDEGCEPRQIIFTTNIFSYNVLHILWWVISQLVFCFFVLSSFLLRHPFPCRQQKQVLQSLVF